MKPSHLNTLKDIAIINLVLTLHSDHQMFIKSWGEFIHGKELNLPNELKNRVFCIWFSGVLDTINEKEAQLENLREQCNDRNLVNCLSLLDEFEELVEAIIESVKTIDFENQLVIKHYRNTLVHARVSSVHRQIINLKCLDLATNTMAKFGKSREDFWKIFSNRITSSVDNFLTPLRESFFLKTSKYFKLTCIMSNPGFSDRLKSIAYKDLKIAI